MTPGYDALMNSAALIDLSSRGRIRVTGEDRARLLHAMTTNHVQQMRPGEGLYAFFLNAQGRILADVYILCSDDHFLLDTEPETRTAVYEHLDRYIIADDATLEDVSETTFCLGIEGPAAVETAQRAALAPPHGRFAHNIQNELSVAGISFTGAPAARVYGPIARKDEVIQSFEGAGAIAASSEDADAARIRHFQPRFSSDLANMLVQETRQMHAVHFQKGCYLGQEIVERIRSRAHVNRTLMGFRFESESVPAPGTKIVIEGKPAGEVTSSTGASSSGASSSTATGDQVFGLAYIRVPYNRAGTTIQIEGHPAELFATAGERSDY